MKKIFDYTLLALSKPVLVLFIGMALLSELWAHRTTANQPAYYFNDTIKFISYTGKVVDKTTSKPIVFAVVQLVGTNIGTVTNADGDFLIKIPEHKLKEQLSVTHIGYKTSHVDLSDIKRKKITVFLELASFPIEEVTVRSGDPIDLLYAAMRKRSANYSTDPVMLTSFYRETIKQNKNYVAVAEAVIDIYKAPYLAATDLDRSKIFKGRKSQDVKKMDTIVFKLQGGPYSALMLDVIKNPGEILSFEFFEFYDYKLSGISYINDRQAYVIDFKQKPQVREPLYEGKIFLDAENLAVTGIDFNLSADKIDQASRMLVRKKPATMNIDILGANYLTKYREINGKWYLAYVRSEVTFKCKWKKKLFSSTYTTMTEMAVTDMEKDNINKFKMKESAKYSDVLAEQVNQFQDPDYWGDYNIIKPDESIEAAIEKLNRRLKRQMRP